MTCGQCAVAASQLFLSLSRASLRCPDDSSCLRPPRSDGTGRDAMSRSCVLRSPAGSEEIWIRARRNRSLGRQVVCFNITSPPLSRRDCQFPLFPFSPSSRALGPAYSHSPFARQHASTSPPPCRCHANVPSKTPVLPPLATTTSCCRSTNPSNG